MSVERLLQISMAVLITLGTVLRSPGQKDVLLPLLLLIAAAVSIYVTDIKKWFRLSHRAANVAALLSVAFALHNFFALDSAAQLSAIARLLTYLQITLLFQEKNSRLYWQFFTLSALQVVVGAALNVSMVFGLLLVLYMFVGLFALTLFFAYREQIANDRDKNPAATAGLLPAAIGQRSQYPLLLRPVPFRSGTGKNPTPAAVGWQALGQAGLIGGGSLLITAVLFVLAPRTGKSDWTTVTEVGANPITGFTPNVKLGDLGTIAQNSHLVMRVKLLDDAGAPLNLIDQPLFRGTLLNYYTKGSWSYRPLRPTRGNRAWTLPFTDQNRGYVRQEITIEPLNESILFSIYPPLQIDPSRTAVQFDPARMRLTRPQRRTEERLSYVLGTTGIYHDRQWPLAPQFGPADGPELGLLRAEDPDQDQPGEVKAVADQVLRDANISADDRFARINALLAYLRDSGTFEYSLEPSARNPNVDPIVDFLRTNRRGHCEYFASALCLLLRSQGIPARIVAGFYGDWNPLTQDYQVRQLHAHSWVEAYLEAAQIPADLQPPNAQISDGGWLTLDPTPGVVTDAATRRGILAPLANALDYTQIMWTTYVVGMTKSFQYESIYGPVVQWVASVAGSLGGAISDIASEFWQWLSADWFGWRGVLTLAVGTVMVIAALRIVQFARRAIARRALRALIGGRRSSERAAIEFYRRLEDLLARRGLVRAISQTPHEFAVSIAPQLALLSGAGQAVGTMTQRQPDAAPRRIADLPRQIVDVFYRARYSGRQLGSDEQKAVEDAISELERTINNKR